MLRECKEEFFHELDAANAKDFWKSIRKLNNKQNTIPTLVDGDFLVDSSQDKATVLNNFFYSCFNPTIMSRWIIIKNNGSGQTQVGKSSSTLSFIPLRLSDAASYVCVVTIASSNLTGDIVSMSVNSQDVRIRSEY